LLPKCLPESARTAAEAFYNNDGTPRLFSSLSDQLANGYVDRWFASIVKPKEFYEKHAGKDSDKIRCYFYNIDLQGRLFLEDTLPKNIATSIKSEKFLNFFFKRLRRINLNEKIFMEENDIPAFDYPFVSPCGKELNFVRPAATPVVFHALLHKQVDQNSQKVLLFGASLEQVYDERNGLAISSKTGRLYHKLTTKDSSFPQVGDTKCDYGLIRSSVSVTISENICSLEDDCDGHQLGILTVRDEIIPIPTLSPEAEPGPWVMPSVADESR
jgi:hypothetical protein